MNILITYNFSCTHKRWNTGWIHCPSSLHASNYIFFSFCPCFSDPSSPCQKANFNHLFMGFISRKWKTGNLKSTWPWSCIFSPLNIHSVLKGKVLFRVKKNPGWYWLHTIAQWVDLNSLNENMWQNFFYFTKTQILISFLPSFHFHLEGSCNISFCIINTPPSPKRDLKRLKGTIESQYTNKYLMESMCLSEIILLER